MKLTPELQSQLEKQLKNHNHESYRTTINLGEFCLYNFEVHAHVMRPEIMTSLLVAKWLYTNREIYRGKKVLDMGCGTGILGIVAALNGAGNVTFSDISNLAVMNTKFNLLQYDKIPWKAIESDLFDNISDKFDFIIFNQPYFPITPKQYAPNDKNKQYHLTSMCGGKRLIHRFLGQAIDHLEPDGKICMSFYHILPDTNDPAVQGPKHGYKVETMLRTIQKDGLQQGEKSIYLLSLK